MLLRATFEKALKSRERGTQGKEMAETVDEITIDWTDENGQQLVRQLKKRNPHQWSVVNDHVPVPGF